MNSKEVFKDILLSCLESIGTPLALSLAIRYESNELFDLPEIKADMYDNPFNFVKDLQAIALFSKNESFKIKSDKLLEAEARRDFFGIEEDNARLNAQFPNYLKTNQEFISRVQRQIINLIGPSPTAKLFDVIGPVYGPGATTSCRGTETTLLHKLQAKPECTPSAIPIIEYLTRGCGLSRPDEYIEVPGNIFFTVPKNYKSRRQCCLEPHLNTWAQRVLGLDLKRALLKRASYDLSAVPDMNKYLLKYHSGDFATLDLKQASDRIYTSFVKEVLPPNWFGLLNQARSHYTNVDGNIHKNAKFSSMGNGFTFELESTLFLGIVRALVPKQHWNLCKVFGDDILVPIKYGKVVAEHLEGLGFILNTDKTFLSGNFKESCGTDILESIYGPLCVRPIYLRSFPDDKPTSLVRFANYIRRISLRTSGFKPKGPNFGAAYTAALKLVPSAFYFTGPDPFLEEDLSLDVPLYLWNDYTGKTDRLSINDWQFPRLKSKDCDGWIHSDQSVASRRLIEVPRFRVKPHNFSGKTQMMYALSGGDPDGCFARSTPTITKIELC